MTKIKMLTLFALMLLLSSMVMVSMNVIPTEAYDPSTGRVTGKAVGEVYFLWWSERVEKELFSFQVHEGISVSDAIKAIDQELIEGKVRHGIAYVGGSLRVEGGKIIGDAKLGIDLFGLAGASAGLEIDPTYPMVYGLSEPLELRVKGSSAIAYCKINLKDSLGYVYFEATATLTYTGGLSTTGTWPYDWTVTTEPDGSIKASHPPFQLEQSTPSPVNYTLTYKSIANTTQGSDDYVKINYIPTVGGIVIPVDKFGLLAPYIGLASTILVAAVATAVYVKRVKRRKEKQ